jgi:hypothetical protein
MSHRFTFEPDLRPPHAETKQTPSQLLVHSSAELCTYLYFVYSSFVIQQNTVISQFYVTIGILYLGVFFLKFAVLCYHWNTVPREFFSYKFAVLCYHWNTVPREFFSHDFAVLRSQCLSSLRLFLCM